jgi:hypothetical protein
MSISLLGSAHQGDALLIDIIYDFLVICIIYLKLAAEDSTH